MRISITHPWRHGLYPLCLSIFRSWSTSRGCRFWSKTSADRCKISVLALVCFTFSSSSDCFLSLLHTARQKPNSSALSGRRSLRPCALSFTDRLRLEPALLRAVTIKPLTRALPHRVRAEAAPAGAHGETKKDETNLYQSPLKQATHGAKLGSIALSILY